MEMLRNPLAVGLAVTASMGAGEMIQTSVADAHVAGHAGPLAVEASHSLNGFGPAFSHNLEVANQQLDERLRIEGSNGCEARAIAKIAGITTSAGRAEYITPGNVDFRRIKNVTNRQEPINTGATANCVPVEIPNEHPTSVAATIELKKAPEKSIIRARKLSDGGYELTSGVLRLDCGGNALLTGKRPQVPKKHNEKQINVNVTAGVREEVAAFAASYSQSHSTSEVQCPDGTTVEADSSAQAGAVAAAAANLTEHAKFSIKGIGVSFSKFHSKFVRLVGKIEAEAVAAAGTSTSSNTNVNCGSTPPPPPNCDTHPEMEQCHPPTPAASFFANNLQEADFNSVNAMRVTVDSATPGDNYEICDRADLGSTLRPSCVDEVAPSDTFNVQRQYTAPSGEASGAPMTDHYYATVKDLTTGKSATPPSNEANPSNPNEFVEPITVQSGDPTGGRPAPINQ